MKNVLTFLALTAICFIGIAQTPVKLNLHPMIGNTPFQLDTTYNGSDLENFNLNSVRVYLGGIELEHDGGQITSLSNTYVLVNANQLTYDLGSWSVTNVEGISFHVGVDPLVNHDDPTGWPNGHPLSPQSPTMHWGWSAGYLFIAFDGKTDADADLIPEKVFEIHTVGDQLLRQVNLNAGASTVGQDLVIDVYYDLYNWLRDIDLSAVGIYHGSSGAAITLSNNINTYEVFRATELVGITTPQSNPYSLHFNYVEMNRPIIYYQAEGAEDIDLTVFDLNGQVVFSALDLDETSGKIRVNDGLSSGIYICQMKADGIPVTSRKFQIFH